MIRNDLESDIMVRSIHDVKATDMGGQTVMFKAEADIDGREITRSYLEKIDIEKLAEVGAFNIDFKIFLKYIHFFRFLGNDKCWFGPGGRVVYAQTWREHC